MVGAIGKSERGVALLAVLLGIALMTLIIVDFATVAGLGFISAANQANELRAHYLARSGVALGLALLAQDARSDAQSTEPIDSLNDPWAVPYPPTTVDGGVASLWVVDEARKLNLNSMINNGQINQPAVARMERLFKALNVNPDIVSAIIEWITPAGQNASGGAGAGFYLGLKPPYQPRLGPMPTIGDLKMIRGVNEVTFNRLRPFLTVMPEPGVNVNTAPPEVLASLAPELLEDPKAVKEIIAARDVKPFQNVTEVGNLPAVTSFSQHLLQPPILGTRSGFFTITATGTFAGARKMINATFKREQNGIGTLASWQED